MNPGIRQATRQRWGKIEKTIFEKNSFVEETGFGKEKKIKAYFTWRGESVRDHFPKCA